MAKTGKVKIELSADDQQLFREMKRLEGKYGSITNAIKEMGRASVRASQKQKRAGREAGKATGFATSQVKSLITSYVGAAGLISAVKQVVGAYDTWKNKMYEIGKATKTAMDSMIAFITLQKPGQKRERLMEMLGIAEQFGIKDFGVVSNIVQAMQSQAGRSWMEAKRAARGILRGRDVGIPIAAGAEAETVGASLGMAAGEAMWRSFATGEASKRTPEAIVKGLPGMSSWKTPEVAFAAAGVLASPFGRNMPVYLRQAGKALQSTSALADEFERLGVMQGTQLDRLKALHEAGYRTTEDLDKIGLAEVRQQTAISFLLRNMGEFQRYISVQRAAESQGIGVFLRKRAQVEKEIPIARAGREMDVAAARLEKAKVTGPHALRAAQMVTEARALSTVLTRRGIYTAFGTELAKESGEAVAKVWPLIMARYPQQFADIKREYQRELDAIRLERASEVRKGVVATLRKHGRSGLAAQIRDLPHGVDVMMRFIEAEIARRQEGIQPPPTVPLNIPTYSFGLQQRLEEGWENEKERIALLKEIRDSLKEQLDQTRGGNRAMVKPNVDEGVGVR